MGEILRHPPRTDHGAALLPSLRTDIGRTDSGVTLFAPPAWHGDLNLKAPADRAAPVGPVSLAQMGPRTRRALHVLARSVNGLPSDRVGAALVPDAGTRQSLHNSLTRLTERGLAINAGNRKTGGNWKITAQGLATAEADLQRPKTPVEVLAGVRLLTAQAHPPALARWWPVADDRHLSPPVTVTTLMAFFFAVEESPAAAPDLRARFQAALDRSVADGTLITLAARRGKAMTCCYWPATPEDPT
jgi:hypothetical protein